MGLLTKMQEKATQEWAKNLTLEQIEEYERQGMDMSEYRVMLEERLAEEKRMADSIDLSMLDKFKGVRTPEFINDVAKFNKLSDKKKAKLENAPLVYGKVVQALSSMFTSDAKGEGGMVILYALDEAHKYDKEWLTKTAERIYELKREFQNQPDTGVEKFAKLLGLRNNIIFELTLGAAQEKKKSQYLPEDIRGFIRCIALDGGSFCIKLGESLSGGADAWCATYSLYDQGKLPFAKIPADRFIPLLVEEQEMSEGMHLIPATYYSK